MDNQIPGQTKFLGHLATVSDEKLAAYVDEFRDISDDPGHNGFAGVAEAIWAAAKAEQARRAAR